MTYPEDFDDLHISIKEEFLLLKKEVRIAYCMHLLEAEVNNGGFHQFFSNSSGEYVPETAYALAEVGAEKTAGLLARAVKLGFPKGYPSNACDYETALEDTEDIADDLEALDTAFFRYDEPLSELVNQYLAKYA